MRNDDSLHDKTIILRLILASAFFTLVCLYIQLGVLKQYELATSFGTYIQKQNQAVKLSQTKNLGSQRLVKKAKSKRFKKYLDDRFLFEPLEIWEKKKSSPARLSKINQKENKDYNSKVKTVSHLNTESFLVEESKLKYSGLQIEVKNQNLNSNQQIFQKLFDQAKKSVTHQIISSPIENQNTQQLARPLQVPKPTTPTTPAPGSISARVSPEILQRGVKLLKARNQSLASDIAKQQKQYYEMKYQISVFQEQPFCIVIPTFKNVKNKRHFHNLNSVLQQDYSNYHIVLIDDASDDGTGSQIEKFAQQHQISEEKLRIIVNKERKMAMPNIYRAAHEFCKPHEIFMVVDGDDQLVGKQVLKFFNSQFQRKNLWLIYSNFITASGGLGYSRPYGQYVIQNNLFRKFGFTISHLRAFYTKLFTLIKQQDLKDQGRNWFRAANDVAMYIPILEMTHQKMEYIPEICYMYNSNTGLNNHRVKLQEQKGNERKIKAKAPYKQLQQLFNQKQKENWRSSLGKKIPIKNLSLAIPDGQIEKYGWEL